MTNVTPFDEDQRSFKLPEQNTQEIYFADKISTNLLKIMFRWSYYGILVRVLFLSTIRDGFGLILSLISSVTNGEWFQRQEIFVPIKHFWGTKSTNWREMTESCDFWVMIITTCAWVSVRRQRLSAAETMRWVKMSIDINNKCLSMIVTRYSSLRLLTRWKIIQINYLIFDIIAQTTGEECLRHNKKTSLREFLYLPRYRDDFCFR